jgi:hypothetical protein
MPNADSATIMQAIDALPTEWRALVHEYGFKAVCQAREDGCSIEDAADQLWMARSARQAQWLSTLYITERSVKSWGNNANAT